MNDRSTNNIHQSHLKTKDFLVTGEEFELRYNSELDLLETYPAPSAEELPGYYNSEEYISHTDSDKGLLSFLYQQVKKYSLKKKLSLINKLHPKGRLLDVGAGTGDFLKSAMQQGWESAGVEPNETAARLAQKKGISLFNSIDDLDGSKFDVITLWHVLEHVPNLKATCAKLENLLSANGVLIVAVPNYNSYDAQFYREYWAAYDTPRHLWHFSQSSMKRIFSKQMALEEIRPMIFDSYYVSLLSEKYKTGKRFSLRSFWIGWSSNWKAKRSGEYSSLIYCFRKS